MKITVFIASFSSYSWDALAVARTREEAERALIAEVMRSYPDCQYTEEEWASGMYTRRATLPFAEAS